jgi:hypothetical protein
MSTFFYDNIDKDNSLSHRAAPSLAIVGVDRRAARQSHYHRYDTEKAAAGEDARSVIGLS